MQVPDSTRRKLSEAIAREEQRVLAEARIIIAQLYDPNHIESVTDTLETYDPDGSQVAELTEALYKTDIILLTLHKGLAIASRELN